MKKVTKKKVYVGLSGGVDSSVSAHLLKEQGYDVTGVFIKVWQPDFLTCTWPEDRRDAMRVCAKLDIPFITLDFEKEYKEEVVDYMLEEYKAGRTPNPDVMCNRFVKFGAFLTWAQKQGADFIATGHYAQIKENSTCMLQTSKDLDKDQTYFLWKLTQNELKHILFPVGHLKKEETRAIAKKVELVTAQKRDSQGLCFLGKLDMKEFLKHFIKTKKGDVVTEEGKVIGSHNGALLYTLGERHGFTITDKEFNIPLYVVDKDNQKNVLVVSEKPVQENLKPNAITLGDCNWIGTAPEKGKEYLIRIRHGAELIPMKLESFSGKDTVLRGTKIPLVSAGQSVVLYEKVKNTMDSFACLGGGVAT